ncbi:protein of unknown function [Clostridium beijerinckii]|nr:protein of unknown function [Clostridium beijerinckii]
MHTKLMFTNVKIYINQKTVLTLIHINTVFYLYLYNFIA